MAAEKPYNPLDRHALAESVAGALLSRPLRPLPTETFEGAGVYAIYYAGDFPAYNPITLCDDTGEPLRPIYVGKAVPAGRRKGAIDQPRGPFLFRRLRDHLKSIDAVANLVSNSFRCRYLWADDIWIPLAETLLIQRFQPLWNVEIDGFGNHDPGAGRKAGKPSSWDVLHPGRPWVASLTGEPSASAEELLERVSSFLSPGTTQTEEVP